MEVGIPDPLGFVIGVTYIVAEDWPLPADLTHFCHFRTSKWFLIKLTQSE